jgi:hypothetical protein
MIYASLAFASLAIAAAQNPRIATNDGDVAVQVAAGKSFSISCPSNGGNVECAGANVEVVDGQCVPVQAFASAGDLAAAIIELDATAERLDELNATMRSSSLSSTYLAWYSASVSSLALRGGDREVTIYGPGLETLYNPGYRNLFTLTATSTSNSAHVVTAKGSPSAANAGSGAVTFELPLWPHGVGEVSLSVRFDPEGGTAIPFQGVTGGNVLEMSQYWTAATYLTNNTVIISGVSFDNAPNTYQCTYTDTENRVVVSPGGTDGRRVWNDETIYCGAVPGSLAVQLISGVPTASVTVGLNRRSVSGSWEPVRFNAAANGDDANEIAIRTCSDGNQNFDETDVDCGGNCSFCVRLNSGCLVDGDCNEGAGHGCRNRRCTLVGYDSCKAAKQAGQNSNGIYNILSNGAVAPTYCDQTWQGGGWTLVLKVTNMDGNANWLRQGATWRSQGYSTVQASNAASCSGRLGNCGGTDFVHPAYSTLGAQNMMLRNALGSTNKLVWTRDSFLRGRTLRSILIQNYVDGGRACSNGIAYGAGTRHYGSYTNLVLQGDERGDTEPGVIGLRNGCAGDSEMMMLGNAQSGGDGSGSKEVHSQSDYWGNTNTAFRGMWVFVRE